MAYAGNPNSAHQLWSAWTFRIFTGRAVPLSEVRINAMRWARLGFGSAGEMKVTLEKYGYKLELRIEGVPANEPGYVKKVRVQFQENYVRKGFGSLAIGTVHVRILAGDVGDGRPASQLVMLPRLVI